jgi:hypothetical protein
MNYIIKAIGAMACLFFFESCIINNAKKQECIVKQIVVSEVYSSNAADIFFKEANGDFYYINRGMERDLKIKQLEGKVMGKKITLHLYTFWFGYQSNHISQLGLDDEILFTEF